MCVIKEIPGVRVRVTELVEPVLVLKPFLVSRVDLPGLAASKQQAASKQHARNEETSDLRYGALNLVEIFVDDTYGCELQSHKV